MFIHTLHVRAPAEELEVSFVPRRIRGKQPAEEPAVVISQARPVNFEEEEPKGVSDPRLHVGDLGNNATDSWCLWSSRRRQGLWV